MCRSLGPCSIVRRCIITSEYYWWWEANLDAPDWVKRYDCFKILSCSIKKRCGRKVRLNDNDDNDNNDGPNTPPGGVIELGPRMSQAGRTLGRNGSGHGKFGPLR